MSSLTIIQQNVARYGLSTLLVLGNVGNLFTILILSRSVKQKLNSCSLYLLAASISNWIVINTALMSNIIGIDHIDPQHSSNIICKLRWSSTHALLMLSRSFMISACIDRWALCSESRTIRSFSQPRQAIRLIIILIIVWTIIPIHMAIFFNNSSGRCIATPGTYAFFYAIYSLFIIGILPLLLMIVFSVRAWHNLRLARTRVAPIGTRHMRIHKRDRDLMSMLTGEVVVYCLTTLPYPINLIYSVSTDSFAVYKSSTRKAVESLIGYIISPLLNFMYCCAQFYVYTACSRKFRKEFLSLFCRQLQDGNRSIQIPLPTTRN
ncbi:unnamed protein product [Rotaria sordida]|uniref:G-protein coupled receptors family 1 profile domain-containing protein n=1 Tax=Rotaria sordida TaxID=392033 RepID=A0A814IN92_9BILA|nr:unnamed protein product [Rotaria sordida]